ncbi:hypothetical protein EMMF5_000178 [Cystobasidiomycetes sp. EMM_F5]
MSSSSSTKKLQPWQSLTAGLVAGAVEGFITYPAEMTKTACQFSAKQGAPVSPLAVVKTTFQQRGIRGFYSGCSALVVGNSAKAGVRFFCYDGIKDLLKDQHTRMQGLEAAAYANSFDCARKVIQQDGVAALWGGSTARLSRLMFSGAIVFTVYEKMAVLLKQW